MRDSLFKIICVPTVLTHAPEGWAAELLADGDLALTAGQGAPQGVREVGEALDMPAVAVLRDDADATAKAFAGTFPLVWVAAGFSEEARTWAQRRGPMTLLIETDAALSDDDLRLVERFVAILDRQAE